MPNAPSQSTPMSSCEALIQDDHVQGQIELAEKIDTLLAPAARSLIELAIYCQPDEDILRETCAEALYFPPWVDSTSRTPTVETFLLTRALCCSSLQRLWTNKRRFPWLTKSDFHALSALQKSLADTFIPSPNDASLVHYAKCLSSKTFGGVNPLTASQVFRVLIYGGENKAHRGIGFLAFFIMVWSLRRRFLEGNIRGASLESSQPTAYLTAKCLFPMKFIVDICQRRAQLYDDMKRLVTELENVAVANKDLTLNHWKFASTLSQLSITLSDMSGIAIARKAFRDLSVAIEERADKLDSYTPSGEIWKEVKGELADSLRAISRESADVSCEAEQVVTQIKQHIIANLKPDGISELAKYKINIGGPAEGGKEYWDDHVRAATEALEICEEAVAYLKSASAIHTKPNLTDIEVLTTSLSDIARANRNLSEKFHKTGSDSARWCHSLVEREIAYASAGNATDFDAAEMVSGIATAVHWRQMTSPLEIDDAIRKAVGGGARLDGSWTPGQPIYTQGRLLGLYPITSDIIWLLAGVIKRYPEVDAADGAFERYVTWLGGRVSEVTTCGKNNRQVKITGWASERSRERDRVDMWTTAFSINALLEIRDLAENRILQVCKRRFNLVFPTNSLPEVDPVDLGARHRDRLHRRLSKMAREAQIGELDAEYAFMLHGPPGSSKTAMAQAVAKEMWREPSASSSRPTRLIRITPADFTRFGEDRLDAEAQLVFTLLTHVRSTVVLFDEVDDLLRKRDPATRPVFMELLIPAMLNRLADLRESCPRQEVCYIFATNFIQNIEPALMRRGRLDAAIPVVYPDTESRCALIERRLEKLREAEDREKDKGKKEEKKKVVEQLEGLKNDIVDETKFWPWMTIRDFLDELCDKSDLGNERNVLVKRYISELNIPAYKVEDLCKPPTPRELLNEFLHYSFSGWSNFEDYKLGFRSQLTDWWVAQTKTESKTKVPPADEQRIIEIVNQGAELWLREGRSTKLTGSPIAPKRGEPEVTPARAA